MNSDIKKKLNRLDTLLKKEFLPAHQEKMDNLVKDFEKFIKESRGSAEEMLEKIEVATTEFEEKKNKIKEEYGMFPELAEPFLEDVEHLYEVEIDNIKKRFGVYNPAKK